MAGCSWGGNVLIVRGYVWGTMVQYAKGVILGVDLTCDTREWDWVRGGG